MILGSRFHRHPAFFAVDKMTPQSDLEIKGNFLTHPFAELIAEIAQARISGSLSVSNKERKCVIYLKDGRVVFAVSNARTSRLFDMMLERQRLTKKDLAQIPNFSNDFEFVAFLEDKKFLTKADSDRLFVEQIEAIIADILSWPEGDWAFSSLKRIRDGLSFDIDTKRLLFDFGRCMLESSVVNRFRSLGERFRRAASIETGLVLTPDEGFVYSRVDTEPVTVADLSSVSAMSESKALHTLYTLWLGGLVARDDWQPAFSESTVEAIRGAKLELKQEAKLPRISIAVETAAEPEAVSEPEKVPEIVLTLDEYLEQVEGAATFYDLLGVDPKAETPEIKRAYFAMAKMFHPDRYHSAVGELFERVQNAFTELAQAHETLKNDHHRELYDYRMRKELAEVEKRNASGNVGNNGIQTEQAAQNFERGFSLLMESGHDEALPFLARAVHFNPKNARYHAYYGKALSADEKQKHKAEQELQAALKLDPMNPTFRILLAEFFIQVNLLKRAEGELKRLLDVFPSNREARNLLATLQVRS